MLHRDVKPSNVLMEGRNPILIDFGLARVADDPKLTQTGWLLGTPGYLAPEILYGDDATAASDIHSWAATVAYAGTGQPPFGRGPSMAIMDRVRRGEHDLTGIPDRCASCSPTRSIPTPTRRPSLDAILGWLRPQVAPTSRTAAPPAPDKLTMPYAALRTSPDARSTDVLPGGPSLGADGTKMLTERQTVLERDQRRLPPPPPLAEHGRPPFAERRATSDGDPLRDAQALLTESGEVRDERVGVAPLAAPTSTGPWIATTTPAARSTVAPSTPLKVVLGRTVVASSVNEDTVVLLDAITGNWYPATVSYESSSSTATLTPEVPVPSGSPFLLGMGGIESTSGEVMPTTFVPFSTSGRPFPDPVLGWDFAPLRGDFNGDGPDDVLLYQPGAAPDFTMLGSWEGFYYLETPVNGDYHPLTADLDGNGYDDVVWYGPGRAPTSSGTADRRVHLTTDLDQRPLRTPRRRPQRRRVRRHRVVRPRHRRRPHLVRPPRRLRQPGDLGERLVPSLRR